MKAIIGRSFGALSLGALLLLTGCRETSSVASAATVPAGTIVNCGEGRQAVVHPVTAGSGGNQVECVPVAGARADMLAYAPDTTAAVNTPAPVRERVVYRTAPARRQRSVERTPVDEPVYRTSRNDEPVYGSPGAEPVAYPDRSSNPDRSSYPSSRRPSAQPVSYPDRSSYPDQSSSRYPADEPQQKSPRSWGKTAIIIAGATAGGAGVGAILGGGSGAKKGAVVGAIAGTIYGVATRNK
jgi:hypothetical protein